MSLHRVISELVCRPIENTLCSFNRWIELCMDWRTLFRSRCPRWVVPADLYRPILRVSLDSGETARCPRLARSIYRSMSTERSLTIRRCWLPWLAFETRTGSLIISSISSIIYSIDAFRKVNDCCKKFCPVNLWSSWMLICAIRLGTVLDWITFCSCNKDFEITDPDDFEKIPLANDRKECPPYYFSRTKRSAHDWLTFAQRYMCFFPSSSLSSLFESCEWRPLGMWTMFSSQWSGSSLFLRDELLGETLWSTAHKDTFSHLPVFFLRLDDSSIVSFLAPLLDCAYLLQKNSLVVRQFEYCRRNNNTSPSHRTWLFSTMTL